MMPQIKFQIIIAAINLPIPLENHQLSIRLNFFYAKCGNLGLLPVLHKSSTTSTAAILRNGKKQIQII